MCDTLSGRCYRLAGSRVKTGAGRLRGREPGSGTRAGGVRERTVTVDTPAPDWDGGKGSFYEATCENTQLSQ